MPALDYLFDPALIPDEIQQQVGQDLLVRHFIAR
jgi:hypothetical protein